MDLSKYKKEVLFKSLEGKRLEHFLGRWCFNERADYEGQAPSIYPLGQLKFAGSDAGRGDWQRWLTVDESIAVTIGPDGTIVWVGENRQK